MRMALQPYGHEQAPTSRIVQMFSYWAPSAGKLVIDKMTRSRVSWALSLFFENFPKHMTAKQAKDVLPELIWNEYFKFGFVRNPWAREFSNFSMLKRNRKTCVANTFEEYILDYLPNNYLEQSSFFYDQHGQQIVDFVGKFENLDVDLETAACRVGVKLRLPHLNKSTSSDYRSHYTEEMVNVVRMVYIRDITNFSYSF